MDNALYSIQDRNSFPFKKIAENINHLIRNHPSTEVQSQFTWDKETAQIFNDNDKEENQKLEISQRIIGIQTIFDCRLIPSEFYYFTHYVADLYQIITHNEI